MRRRGSILLVQVLVVSAVTLLLVLAASSISVSTSTQYLNHYSSQDLFYAAEGCLEEVISRLEDDPSLTSLVLNIGEINCAVQVVDSGTKLVNIDVVLGDYSQSFSAELSLVVNGQANNISLLEWKKL